MNIWLKLWQFMDGKKSTLALLYWTVVVPSLVILWPDNVPVWIDKSTAILGLLLSALGLGHGIVKTKKGIADAKNKPVG